MEEINRKDRISLARQECMMMLENKSVRYGEETEKQERIMQNPCAFPNSKKRGGSWKIRLFFAVLFFFFVLGIRQKKIQIGEVDYALFQGQLQNNTWVLQVEEVAKTIAIENKE